MSISKAIKFPGLFLLVAVASFPFAEGAFRLLGDRPSEDLTGLFAPFMDGSYKLAARVHTQATWAAGNFTVHTDDLGLRCDQNRKLATKPGDHLDALFLGDSQGFGHGVSFEDSLAGAVAVLASSEKLRVANASVGGHGARNQLALVRWLRENQNVSASQYVVLATPVFAYNADSFARAAVGPDGRLYDSSNHQPSAAARLRLWLKTTSVVYARLRDAFVNSGAGSKPKDDSDIAFQLYGAGTPEVVVRAKLVAYLSELQAFAAQQGAGVTLVYIPLTVEVEFDPMQRAADKRGLKLDPDLPSRLCAAAAAELNLPFHNLRPVIAQLHAQGDALRLKGDFHYNRTLSKACANYLWNALHDTLN